MAQDIILTSLHGRKFGLTSSGGVLAREGSTQQAFIALMQSTANVAGSTLLDMQVLKNRSVTAAVASSVGSTMNSYGTNIVSSGTATAVILQIGRPTLGQRVEILARASASELTIGGTSTSILIGAGTTGFLSMAGGVAGASIVLRGESTTRYGVIGKSTDWVIS